MLVQQPTRYRHQKGKPSVLMKLDITKAFDSVSWAFMIEVLCHLGFGTQWIGLLCQLLHSSSTRVLLNGEPGDPIHHHRGLRQGNPLSPMLFIIVMDVLSGLIYKAEEQALFTPLLPGTGHHRISFYADDVVILASPGTQEIDFLKSMLNKFDDASVLHTNMMKSSFILIDCSEE